jgi:hypothetical protein
VGPPPPPRQHSQSSRLPAPPAWLAHPAARPNSKNKAPLLPTLLSLGRFCRPWVMRPAPAMQSNHQMPRDSWTQSQLPAGSKTPQPVVPHVRTLSQIE